MNNERLIIREGAMVFDNFSQKGVVKVLAVILALMVVVLATNLMAIADDGGPFDTPVGAASYSNASSIQFLKILSLNLLSLLLILTRM